APGGEPISVAHDEHIAVAVAVLSGARHLAIGVDIEPWATFPAEVGPVVVRPDEGGIDPCLAFCVKEAAYKAWSAHGGGLLGHDDVRITIDGERANARVVADGVDIAGVWASGAGRCLALAWLRM
ncbi:MAG: hypothetical protein CL424_13750, partial [Acidimicrobiaceae bacterium]|nr:hypothetical protein [Acidimicrobiaceae bacterium]